MVSRFESDLNLGIGGFRGWVYVWLGWVGDGDESVLCYFLGS